jgi:hypothetical protein
MDSTETIQRIVKFQKDFNDYVNRYVNKQKKLNEQKTLDKQKAIVIDNEQKNLIEQLMNTFYRLLQLYSSHSDSSDENDSYRLFSSPIKLNNDHSTNFHIGSDDEEMIVDDLHIDQSDSDATTIDATTTHESNTKIEQPKIINHTNLTQDTQLTKILESISEMKDHTNGNENMNVEKQIVYVDKIVYIDRETNDPYVRCNKKTMKAFESTNKRIKYDIYMDIVLS